MLDVEVQRRLEEVVSKLSPKFKLHVIPNHRIQNNSSSTCT